MYITTSSADLSCPVQGLSQPCVLVAQDPLVCSEISDTLEGKNWVCRYSEWCPHENRDVDRRRSRPRIVSLDLTFLIFSVP